MLSDLVFAELELFGAELRVYAPVLGGKAFVVVVAPAGVVFGCLEEFFGFFGVEFGHGSEAYLAFEEVGEFAPVGLFGVEGEGVLTLFFKGRVVAPQLPVTAFYGQLFFALALAHAGFQAVVDAGGVCYYERWSVV